MVAVTVFTLIYKPLLNSLGLLERRLASGSSGHLLVKSNL